LPVDQLSDIVPSQMINAAASGYPIPVRTAARLAKRLGLQLLEDVSPSASNPSWKRDELILAMDAYVRWNGNPPAKSSRQVADLSRTLNDLCRALGTTGNAKLRNANGVYMKLMNFRRFDPAFTGEGKSGLLRGNHLEAEIWKEFYSRPAYLSRVAQAIRNTVQELLNSGTDPGADDEQEALEGALLARSHLRRERSRKIVLAKKAAAINETGRLECEVCRFDFKETYGNRGDGVIECHHTKPVAELGDGTPTKLKDLVLLCANCHRIVHSKRPWLSVEELRSSVSPRTFLASELLRADEL
jgi:5-methylcytosine-specific restriction enzyme A